MNQNMEIFFHEILFQNATKKLSHCRLRVSHRTITCTTKHHRMDTYLRNVWISVQYSYSLQWRHNGRDGVSNLRRLHYLLKCWFRHRSKKTSKLRVTGLCVGNSPVTGEFSAQKSSNAENVSIWWRHHATHVSLQVSRDLVGHFEWRDATYSSTTIRDYWKPESLEEKYV